MTDNPEQRLGFGFGLLGGILVALGGLVSLVVGMSDLVLGHSLAAVNAESAAVVLFVVGGLAAFFAWLGHRAWSGRPLTSGLLLVVLALIGWLVMGFGSNVLALVGSLFVFLAGILYLVDPAKRVVSSATAST
jgi:hypothetical protein